MTAARQRDPVRTRVATGSIFDGRAIPAGAEGTVLEAGADGTCLAEVAFRPQTDSQDGDFVPIVPAQGQYEIIRA